MFYLRSLLARDLDETRTILLPTRSRRYKNVAFLFLERSFFVSINLNVSQTLGFLVNDASGIPFAMLRLEGLFTYLSKKSQELP
jgi:hypothetical protein